MLPFAAAAILIFLGRMAWGQSIEGEFLFTADGEGHIRACSSCPMVMGEGGLDRRATALNSLRGTDKPSLLIDGGNSFFGGDSAESQGKVIVEAMNYLHYDVVNLGYPDFRYGIKATQDLLKGAQFEVISANLTDDSTGQLLTKPFVVKSVGAKKVAVIGLTQRPAAMDVLPTLREELAGVRIEAPGKALGDVLPKAKGSADAVILVYYGSAAEARELYRQYGNDLSAMFVGGIRPDELSDGDSMVAVTRHGTSIARAHLTGAGHKPAIDAIAMDASVGSDAGMEKLMARFAPTTLPAATGEVVSSLPTTIPLDGFATMYASGRSNGLSISVNSMGMLSRFGEWTAPKGSRLLVIGATMENLLPPQDVKGQETPVAYRVPQLYDNLYVVADGRVLPRHDGAALPGEFAPGQLDLPQMGSTASNKLMLRVPADFSPRQLSIDYFDYAHGNILIPLMGDISDDSAKPIGPPVKNQVLEAEILSVQHPSEWGSQKAGAGMSWLCVDLRARSLVTIDADATAFDPSAKKGDKLKIGTVADWKQSRQYTQVVVDGQYAYSPSESSTLAAEPRFLPEVFTGGTLAFLVPEGAKSLSLRCDFPNAKVNGQSGVTRPDGLEFQLEGSAPRPGDAQAIGTIKDSIFNVEILDVSAQAQYGDSTAASGQKYFVLQVRVKNLSSTGETFQTKDQLKYTAESGRMIGLDHADYLSPHRPWDLLWIPKGETRAFDLVYLIPATDMRPRLAYASPDQGGGKIISLPGLQ